MLEIRYLDKLVDELAKGRPMEKNLAIVVGDHLGTSGRKPDSPINTWAGIRLNS